MAYLPSVVVAGLVVGANVVGGTVVVGLSVEVVACVVVVSVVVRSVVVCSVVCAVVVSFVVGWGFVVVGVDFVFIVVAFEDNLGVNVALVTLTDGLGMPVYFKYRKI